jgi:hypothetical protein
MIQTAPVRQVNDKLPFCGDGDSETRPSAAFEHEITEKNADAAQKMSISVDFLSMASPLPRMNTPLVIDRAQFTS